MVISEADFPHATETELEAYVTGPNRRPDRHGLHASVSPPATRVGCLFEAFMIAIEPRQLAPGDGID
jgi:hypothetical protein